MDKARMAKMASKIAQEETEDEALAFVDQSIDTIIRAIRIIDENLSKVKTENVPQKAAIDATRELLDEAIAPYMADMVKVMEVFPD